MTTENHNPRENFQERITKKLDDMIASGELAWSDFEELNDWDQEDVSRRALTEFEIESLKKKADQRLQQHNQNKM